MFLENSLTLFLRAPRLFLFVLPDALFRRLPGQLLFGAETFLANALPLLFLFAAEGLFFEPLSLDFCTLAFGRLRGEALKFRLFLQRAPPAPRPQPRAALW